MLTKTNIILGIIATILLGFWISVMFESSIFNTKIGKNTNISYIGNDVKIINFTKSGKKHYQAETSVARYFDDGHSEFDNPLVYLFDKDNQNSKSPTWISKSKFASLDKQQLLHLNNEINIDSLNSASKLKKIVLANAIINLDNYDITSDSYVELYGDNFTSKGVKLIGNLQKQQAKLLEKVKVYYEIKK